MSAQRCILIFVGLVCLISAAPTANNRLKRQTIFFEDELDQQGTPKQGTSTESEQDKEEKLSRNARAPHWDAFGTPAFGTNWTPPEFLGKVHRGSGHRAFGFSHDYSPKFGYFPQFHGGPLFFAPPNNPMISDFAKGPVDEAWRRPKRQFNGVSASNQRPTVAGSWNQNQPNWNEIGPGGDGNTGPNWDNWESWLGNGQNNNGGAWNGNQRPNGNGGNNGAWNNGNTWNGNQRPNTNGNNNAWNGNGGAWNGNQRPNGNGDNQNSWNNGGAWNGNNQNGDSGAWNGNQNGAWNNQGPAGSGNQNSWSNGGAWNGNNQRPNGNNQNSGNNGNNNGGGWNGNGNNQNFWNNNGGSSNGNSQRPNGNNNWGTTNASGNNGNFGNSILPPNNNNSRPRPNGNNNGKIRPPIAIGGARPPSTTPRPNCDCPATAESNPVCGTDGNTYVNPSRLRCARVCGTNVQMQHYGACSATTPATDFRRG